MFQRGLYHLNLFRNLGRQGDFDRAAAALQQAIDQQPGRADGPIGMALLHSARIVTGASPGEVIGECERWVRQAMAVNPRASKTWAILGEIETIRRPEQVRRPLEYGLKAAAFGPRDGFAHTRLAGCFMMHSYELALIAAMEGARLDPLMLDAPIYAAISLNVLDRTDEALAMIRRVLEIEPDMVFGRLVEAFILADCGRGEEARALLATLQPMVETGRLLPQWPALFADVAAYRDATREGDHNLLDRLHVRLARYARGEEPFPRWQVTTQGITRLVAKAAPDLALDLFAARALMGIVEPYDYLITHRELAPLRNDVRFQRLLATSRRNFDEVTAIIHEGHQRGEVPEYVVGALNDLARRFELPAVASRS